MTEDFYKDKYFEQLNSRIDVLEGKIDTLTDKVVFIKGWSAGFGALFGGATAIIAKVLLKI